MRKFLSIIVNIVGAVTLVIIGVLGCIVLKDTPDVPVNVITLTSIVCIVGGFGGSIALAINALKSFFKAKTKTKIND